MKISFTKLITIVFALTIAVNSFAQQTPKYSEFQQQSIYYAAKIWGFVKYYHPEARLGGFDIDSSLVVLLDKSIKSANATERNRVFTEWVANFGKVKELEQIIIKDSSQYKQLYDYSWIECNDFDKKLQKQLANIKNAKRTDSCMYASLEHGFLFNFDKEKAIVVDFSGPHQKMIPLIRYWNVIEYYFPYKYLTDKKWDSVLKEYIPIFADTGSEYRLNTAIRFLSTEINDGHSKFKDFIMNMMHPFSRYHSPIELIYSKDKFIVAGINSDYETDEEISDLGLELGDEILLIDKREPKWVMDNIVSKHWGASNKEYLYNKFNSSLLTSDTTVLDIVYCRDGDTIKGKTKLGRYQYKDIVNTPDREKLTIIDSIAYLNVVEVKPSEVYALADKFLKTKGLILDMRSYPNHIVDYALEHILNYKRVVFTKFSQVVSTMPGIFESKDHEDGISGHRNYLYYRGKVVVLVNSSTISSAEFTTMSFQTLPNVTTIGSTTAGADGNVVYVPLTDKASMGFSSMGIYYPDGGDTQRVGVRIGEYVYPTPKGIKEGRDELRERAIEIIKNK